MKNICSSLCLRVSVANVVKNENGSALVSVMIVIMAISILFSVTIAGAYHRHRIVSDKVNAAKALYRAEAGIYKRMDELGANGFSMADGTEQIDLWDNAIATVSARAEGGMVRLVSSAKAGRITKQVEALVGQRIPDELQKAIVLGRSRSALVLADRADITGDVLVHRDGVKPSKVPGHYYKSKQLIKGRVQGRKELKMPETDTRLLDRFINRAKNILAAADDVQRYVDGSVSLIQADIDSLGTGVMYVQGDITISNRIICKKPVVLAATGAIIVSGNGTLHGSAELFAYHGVLIKDGAEVKNGILFSPEDIVISGSAGFSGQAVTEHDLIVKDNADVVYPAALISRGRKKGNTLTGAVRILDHAQVQSSCIYIPEAVDKYAKTNLVVVEKSAQVTGIVYSGTLADIRGTVYGTVITGTFYYYASPTSYYNWLKDCTIDHSQLPDRFAVPFLFSGSAEPEIVAWREL